VHESHCLRLADLPRSAWYDSDNPSCTYSPGHTAETTLHFSRWRKHLSPVRADLSTRLHKRAQRFPRHRSYSSVTNEAVSKPHAAGPACIPRARISEDAANRLPQHRRPSNCHPIRPRSFCDLRWTCHAVPSTNGAAGPGRRAHGEWGVVFQLPRPLGRTGRATRIRSIGLNTLTVSIRSSNTREADRVGDLVRIMRAPPEQRYPSAGRSGTPSRQAIQTVAARRKSRRRDQV